MADTNYNAVIRVKDGSGNLNSIYPITKKENIIGLADATTTAAGLMTANDKSKLDNIAANANNYSLPTASSTTLGGVKTGAELSATTGYTAVGIKDGVIYYHDTTYTSLKNPTSITIKSTTGTLTETVYDGATAKTVDITPASIGAMAQGTGDDAYVTKSYVDTKVSDLVDSAPGTLDTLNELAAALGDDPNFATTVATDIGKKADKSALDTVEDNSIVGLSISGKTITYTKGDDSTGTLTTQDTTYHTVTTTTNDTGLMTAAMLTKLNGIAENANNYSLPIASDTVLGGIKVGTNLAIDATTGVLSATDTTYSEATTGAAGLMSAADKTKLDGIASQANKYTLPKATSSALGGVMVGDTISSTTDYTAVKVDSTGKIYYKDTNTTYPEATATTGGLLTDAMAVKLNGIAASANNYSHPTYTSTQTTKALYNITVDGTGHVSATTATTGADLKTLIGEASQSASGVMSTTDKTKVDGIDSGATKSRVFVSETQPTGLVTNDVWYQVVTNASALS